MSHTAPDVIVLHGALGSAAQMAPVADALAVVGRVRVLEFPGHGATPGGDVPFTIRGFADWLGATLPSRPERAPVVFGYSMGGYVALALEARSPGTFGGIATLGTKFAWTPALAAREGARLDPALLRAKVPKFASVLEARHGGAGGWESVLARTAGLLADLGGSPVLDAGTLGAVRPRVVLGVGDADDTVDVAETGAFAAMILGGEHRVLAATPHPIERVAPPLVVDLVRRVSGR